MAEDGQPVRREVVTAALAVLIAELRTRADRSTPGPPPLLGFTLTGNAEDLRAAIAHGLGADGARQVPHALIDVGGTAPATTDDLRALLKAITDAFATGAFGRGQQPRFPRFWLLDFVFDQSLGPDSRKHRVEMAKRVRDDSRLLAKRPEIAGEFTATATWSDLPLGLSAALPLAVFRLITAWRLPGTGRVLRWVMRRAYVARREASIWALAVGLSRSGTRRESPEARRLLVHAVLRDLADEFHRVPWRVRPWRATTLPVLVLFGPTATNAGGVLLELVDRVREEQRDPLVIATVGVADHGADLFGRDAVTADEVTVALDRWRADPRGKGFVVDVGAVGAPVRAAVTTLVPRREPPRPPWFTHWLVLLLVPLVLVAGLAVVGLRALVLECAPLHLGAGRVDVSRESGECVGYSDHADRVFGSDERLRQVQLGIFAENRRVEAAKAATPSHPVMTLVYFGTLTKPDSGAGDQTFAAEREELQGFAVAQHRANATAATSADAPYLSIVVANGGQNMGAARAVAEKLRELRAEDSSVLGVVGLVESRETTKQAIADLGVTDLPIIAPTLSADGIGGLSGHFLQIAAPNADQSRLVVDYVANVLRRQRIFNYFTFGPIRDGQRREDVERGDLYVNTLREDLGRDSAAADLGYEEQSWTGQSLRPVCSDRFPDGVVFFGGRYSEFAQFIDTLYRDCSGKLPVVIGDDSVNRYLANAEARDSAPPTLPLTYVSKGSLAFCGNLVTSGDSERRYFLEDVRTTLGACLPDTLLPVGERVGLAYDAVLLLVRTTQDLIAGKSDKSLPDPLYLYTAITDHTRDEPYQGVTGPLSFTPGGVAQDKHLALLCVPDLPNAFTPDHPVPDRVHEIGRRAASDAPAVSRPCG
ncbi:hypothetical protein L6E12_12050 [Actinokineospora sp. PR83]|uniref:hypothetical protein n=1 Tax=Actinokineospora sp. PR83 TaxID=2884908 RepID=UPI001F458DC0|nr:hypothetical protein [Actinokineospora sp. PR83]MCG8916521.1 hypothetical protein [Actinokineospora sp. PR83]